MRSSVTKFAVRVLSIAIAVFFGQTAHASLETKRCLTREQLNVEPIFSACPWLIDEASVSDNSFISTLFLDPGYQSYSIRWQGPDYFHQRDYDFNPETQAYEGPCGSQFCRLYPPAWVSQEHWSYFVGTLQAADVGTWTYSELRNGEVFQSRTFEVHELELEALSGAGQIGLVDEQLPLPLVLQLRSFERTGIEGEVIGWSIDGPKGAKGAVVYGIGSGSYTNSSGIDEAFVHLGSKPGTYTVTLNNHRVTAASQPSFTFTAIDDIADTDPETEHPEYEEGVGLNGAQQCDMVGNPIGLSLGNKFQREVDLPQTGLSPLEFIRYHNSLGFLSRSFRNYWTHSYDRYVELPADPLTDPVKVVRPDGKKLNFQREGGAYSAFPGVFASLEETADGWRFTAEDETVETFDAAGLLLSITDRAGLSLLASHDNSGRLSRIESTLGDALDLEYDNSGRLAAITHNSGSRWVYRYEELGRLAFVDAPDGSTRQYHYEDLRHAYALTGITLEDGQRYAWYRYDELGRAVASWHAGETNRVDIEYREGGGRLVTDPLGSTTAYQTRIANKRGFLDAIGGPLCSEGCGETDTQYGYDADWNVISRTQYGVTTLYGDYDLRGQPGYVIEAAGTAQERRNDYEYDPRFRNFVTRVEEPSVYPGRTRITARTYDSSGNLVEETVSGFDPAGQAVSRTMRYVHDGPYGQLSSIDGPRDDVLDVTTLEYWPDAPAAGANRARLRAVIDPTGLRLRDDIAYSATGKIVSEQRPNGIKLQYEYDDGSDRLLAVTQFSGGMFNRTRWEYLPTGEVSRIVVDDESDHEIITRFGYDDARRLTDVYSRIDSGSFAPAAQHVHFEFDAAGNIIGETHSSADAPGSDLAIERSFDAYNRLDTLIRGGIAEDFDYNPDGTLAEHSDGNQVRTVYDYDALRRLTRTEQLGDGANMLDYDMQSNLLRVTDPEGQQTSYGYDDLGNRVWLDNPDSGLTEYRHDEAGQLIAQTDALGQRTTFSYDAAGRVIQVDRPGVDDDIDYLYDACGNGLGRLCQLTTGWGHSIRYGWNALGQLSSVTTPEGRLDYDYGPSKQLASITYPSGRTVRFELDGGGLPVQIRLQGVGRPEAVLVDEIAYSPTGRPVGWRFANGLETTIDVDGRQRTRRIEVPGVWSWHAGSYDGADNLLGLTRANETLSFAYDSVGRLLSADSASWSRAFTYDLLGNRLSQTSDGLTEYASYQPGSSRLQSLGDRIYSLDANGNTVAVRDGHYLDRELVYSPHNRLVAVNDPGNDQISYRYDALGQRVEKQGEAGTRQFMYGLNGELLVVTDGAGVILHEYVYLGGQPVIDLDQPPETSSPAGPGEAEIDTDQARVVGANWQNKSHPLAINGSYLQNRKRDNRAVYWYIDGAERSGPHDVYVHWLNPDGSGYSTTYMVQVINGIDAAFDYEYVNIAHGDHVDGDWVLLGNFNIKPYDPNARQFVGLSGGDNRGAEGTFLEADAVRIVPTGLADGDSSIHFIHGDHLGTPQHVSNEEGNVVWSASYRPFGSATVDEDVDGDGLAYEMNLRFPGQYFDGETGLHYNYYRTYDPELGRYLEPDPIGLNGGVNPFLYAAANPLKAADRTGLRVEGTWLETPRFNLVEAGVDDWDLVPPTLSPWGYLEFVRLLGHASGFVNIDVSCRENCRNWEIHDQIPVAVQGWFDAGPNLYAIGVGLITRNPFAGLGANVAIGGAALLQAEHHFLAQAQQSAGPIISAALKVGPTLICLGYQLND